MKYIPTNKKTGISYPAINESEKTQWESNPNTRRKFTFTKVAEAPEPKEAKRKKND